MNDILPSERLTYLDAKTGVEVIQWTLAACKNHHLYFTSHSVTADNRWLVFLSERDGHPNIYAIDRGDGGIRRLSKNRDGLLRSYVYPRRRNPRVKQSLPESGPHSEPALFHS